jgi:hypothetical protein
MRIQMPRIKTKLIHFLGLALLCFTFSLVACQPQKIGMDIAAQEVESVMKTTSPSVNFKSMENTQFLGNVAGKPSKLYRIAQENLQEQSSTLFPVNQYAPDFGPNFMANSKVQGICNSVKLAREKVSNAEEWRKLFKDVSAKITVPVLGAKAEVGISRLDLLIDMVKKILPFGTVPSKTKIFIRGFADRCKDSKNCAVGSLLDNYKYERVNVHPFVNKNSQNPESSGFQEVMDNILSSDGNGKFTNENLPDLRATFFAKEFVEKLVTGCEIPGFAKEVGVLKGRVDPTASNDPGERKVEVYIAIYPENT